MGKEKRDKLRECYECDKKFEVSFRAVMQSVERSFYSCSICFCYGCPEHMPKCDLCREHICKKCIDEKMHKDHCRIWELEDRVSKYKNEIYRLKKKCSHKDEEDYCEQCHVPGE